MSNLKKILTITEAADFLKVSKMTLRRWSNSGKLPCFRVGRRNERRFLLGDLVEFMSINPEELVQEDEPSIHEDLSELNQEAHKHICMFYKDPQEQWLKLRSILLEYINSSSSIAYVYNGNENHVINWLKSENIDTQELIKKGLFNFYSIDDSFLLRNSFNIDQTLEFWKQTIVEISKNDGDKILLTAEMGWVNSHNQSDYSLIIPYELILSNLLQEFPNVTMVCQYPVYQFSGAIVYDNLCLHTHILEEDRIIKGLGNKK